MVVTVLALAVALALTVVEGRERARARADVVRRVTAAGDLLARVPLPAGTSQCLSAQEVRRTAGLCWESAAQPRDVAADLVAGLRGAGASDVRGRCVLTVVLGPVCAVTATVAGSPLRSIIGPKPGTGPTGPLPWVTELDASTTLDLPVLPDGAEVPLPAR